MASRPHIGLDELSHVCSAATLPVAYGMAAVLLVMSVVLIAGDIVAPISLS